MWLILIGRPNVGSTVTTLSAFLGIWEVEMLYYSLLFLILAVISGVFGFSGVAGTAAWIAQALFFLFLIGLIVTAVYNLTHRNQKT